VHRRRTIDTLRVFHSASGTKLFDSISFAGVTEVDIANDVEIEAGTNGNVSSSPGTNQFSKVAEPDSIMLAAKDARLRAVERDTHYCQTLRNGLQ
jgi:hypothetical protein